MTQSMTVAEALEIRERASESEKHVYDLIDCCLNAEAALTMLGAKRVKPRRGLHFRPAGALALEQIMLALNNAGTCVPLRYNKSDAEFFGEVADAILALPKPKAEGE